MMHMMRLIRELEQPFMIIFWFIDPTGPDYDDGSPS